MTNSDHGKHPDIWRKLDQLEDLVKQVSNDSNSVVGRMKRLEKRIDTLSEEVRSLKEEEGG